LVNDRYDEQIAAAMVHCDPALDGRALWEGVRDEIERRLQPDDIDSAIAMLIALQTNPPASMPADSQEALDQTLARARHVRVEKDTVLVNGALQSLAEDSDDERARQTIIQLGARALPALRDALRSALQAEQPDADRIQLLYDLVKSLAPDWPGFPANAALEEKLTSLDQIDT
jgi:hypothetical protein